MKQEIMRSQQLGYRNGDNTGTRNWFLNKHFVYNIVELLVYWMSESEKRSTQE